MRTARTAQARPTLFSPRGERKYLDRTERARFVEALDVLSCPVERLFCETIYWTGCRPSEALAMTQLSIDAHESAIVICSLKKRGKQKGKHFRVVPVPNEFMARLVNVFGLTNRQENRDKEMRLFLFSRTKAWQIMRRVMVAAGLSGPMSCARGLRHSFGVNAALSGVPESRIKIWLGHSRSASTEVYLDISGEEERRIAARMWDMRDDTLVEKAQPSAKELIRLVNAYSAIEAPMDRQAFLATVEDCVLGQFSRAEHSHTNV